VRSGHHAQSVVAIDARASERRPIARERSVTRQVFYPREARVVGGARRRRRRWRQEAVRVELSRKSG